MNYRNEEPDWDVDETMLVLIQPYMPSFLLVCTVGALALIVTATVHGALKRRRGGDQQLSAPSWL